MPDFPETPNLNIDLEGAFKELERRREAERRAT